MVELSVVVVDSSAAVGDPHEARAAFERIEGVTRAEIDGEDGGFVVFRLHLEREDPIGEHVAELARDRGWKLRELRRDDRSLEQVFHDLTGTTGVTA